MGYLSHRKGNWALRRLLGSAQPTLRSTIIIGLVFIAGFIILGVGAIQGWEFTNSNFFCATACHAVHPEEPGAFQDSYHARVRCVECHMGRVGTIQAMFLKVGHSRDLLAVLSGQYERPVQARSMRPANESCERCHWPPAFHGDTVREVRRFQPDETNSLVRTFLIMKTGGGERERGLGRGVHWHIENRVEYIATDERRQDIRWVRSVLPDGRTVEYSDVLNPLSADEISKSIPRVMECVDCHNRAGHPFPSPETAVDRALAEGRVSPELPFVKKEMTDLFETEYESQQAAEAAADGFEAGYRERHPDVAAAQSPQVAQVGAAAKDLVPELVFEDQEVNWRSFADNSQHRTFAGCFRCHDGKHVSADGESIRLHCNICHSIPVEVGPNDRPPAMPIASVQEPESHLATNFMADHRFQASEEACSPCHGAIKFGSDNSSFCANAACHGRAWPEVKLDAAFPHPIALEGKHAQVWCHDCHKGVQKPVYQCANCHEPPANHFEAGCESCHTPYGWRESAAAVIGQATRIPHPLEGRDNCVACHAPSSPVRPAPADHEGRSSPQCGLCHKPA